MHHIHAKRRQEATVTMTMTKELSRLVHILMSRGALMLALGFAAVARPEEVLVSALVLVGTIAALFGLYEASVAVTLRPNMPRWRLALFHGLASMAFGLLTMGVAAMRLRVALVAVALWLLCYALLAVDVARSVWTSELQRWSLMLWAAFNVAVAALALIYPEPTIFALLFLGALYAALFGAWQLMVGLWLQRALHRHIGSAQHLHLVA
ncbi:MAG TPA: DUF308 domain-containing protein [Gemmatimonadaceae bacterium]